MARPAEFLTGSSGFTYEDFDQAAPTNTLILNSRNFWFNPNGQLEQCGGTIVSPISFAGDAAFLFGDGFGTVGTGNGTAFGNAAKYIGNIAVFCTNDDVHIYDPTLGATPFTIPFAGVAASLPLSQLQP